MNRNEDFKADLLEELRSDRDYAAEYLSAAKADSSEAFLVALRDVAEAFKGMKRVAKEANVNRENLYRALSKKGNPRIETLDSVLGVLGMETKFVAKDSSPPDQPPGNLEIALLTVFSGSTTVVIVPQNADNKDASGYTNVPSSQHPVIMLKDLSSGNSQLALVA